MYEATAAHGIVPDCTEIHCFRVLVPWVLGRLPGSSTLKWKAYAVVANAGAATALGWLCLILGLTRRSAALATAIAAAGFGSMYTLFDPYTSDPLMFMLGPLITGELLTGRRARAGLVSAVGVLAKEFAVVPVWMVVLWSAIQRRWDEMQRVLVAAMAAMLVWASLQLTLMVLFHYRHGDSSASADFLSGAVLVRWVRAVGPAAAFVAVFVEFGALYLLALFGWRRATADLRLLAIAAAPAALFLATAQQPDRALWNFHFVVIPLAVLALERAPDYLAWAFAGSFGLSNLRFGAQLRFLPPGRFALAVSLVLAAAIVWYPYAKSGWRSA